MSIPESEIVSVTLSASQQATSENGFGLTCLFGTSTYLPSAQRFGLFASLTDVGAVFPVNAPEYLAAQVYFSANASGQAPSTLMIARMFTAAVAAEIIGAPVSETVLQFAAIANGALTITIDGTPENITAVNFAGAASYPAVAAILQTAIQLVKVGATCTWNGSGFVIQSGTTGAASTISFAAPAPAGTDLGPLMKLRQVDGGVVAGGSDVETLTQSLANVSALFSDFYTFAIAEPSPTDVDIEAAAAFALANGIVFGFISPEPGAALAGTTNDVFSVLKASTNKRVIGMFDLQAQNPYGIMSVLAQAAQVDFQGTDTTQTLMFKQLPGVSVSKLTLTQKRILDSKNANYYVNIGGNPMFAKGVMADGTWFDQLQGLDWLSAAAQAAVFAGMYGSRKFPQSDRGMAGILHLLEVPFSQGVKNGLLAPGKWNGAPIGQINTGDILNKGFYLFADSVNNQSQNVRNTRIGPPITAIAKGAGALQGINIILNFEE